MLTKGRRSFFMIVSSSLNGKRRLFIPIPLFVVDVTIRSAADFIWFWEQLFGSFRLHSSYFYQLILLIQELRKYGRYRMIEIEIDNIKVLVDFY